MHEEPDLLERLRVDKDLTFTGLVARHHRALVMAARSLIGGAEAEEVVQEAWISAYRSIDRFEGRSSIRTWLYRIVINEAKMRLRPAGRDLMVSADLSDDNIVAGYFLMDGKWKSGPVLWNYDTPDEILQERELLDCLRKAMAALPQGQRQVLELRDLQGMDFEEICNALEITASNARVLLHRARGAIYRMVDIYQETGRC